MLDRSNECRVVSLLYGDLISASKPFVFSLPAKEGRVDNRLRVVIRGVQQDLCDVARTLVDSLLAFVILQMNIGSLNGSQCRDPSIHQTIFVFRSLSAWKSFAFELLRCSSPCAHAAVVGFALGVASLRLIPTAFPLTT